MWFDGLEEIYDGEFFNATLIRPKYDENVDEDKFIALKRETNLVKSKIDDLKRLNDKDKDFEKFVWNSDPYVAVQKLIERSYRGEFVNGSWLKMYEILKNCKIISYSQRTTISVFHNAEVNGSFVGATKYFLKKNFSYLKYNWMATSFVEPQKNNRFRLEKKCIWLNGFDQLAYSVQCCREKFPLGVDLYTSNATCDCSYNFNNQENAFHNLNEIQIECGLCCLKKGGSMIIKQYSFFNLNTRRLIGKLVNSFETVQVVKPSTSRKLNNEVFLVCKNFLLEYYPFEICPINVDAQLFQIATYLYQKQQRSIEIIADVIMNRYVDNIKIDKYAYITDIRRKWLKDSGIHK